jgi:hypothetical protein
MVDDRAMRFRPGQPGTTPPPPPPAPPGMPNWGEEGAIPFLTTQTDRDSQAWKQALSQLVSKMGNRGGSQPSMNNQSLPNWGEEGAIPFLTTQTDRDSQAWKQALDQFLTQLGRGR